MGLCVCATNIARGHTGPYLLLTVSAVVFFRPPALKKRDLPLLTWSEITDLDHNAYFFFFFFLNVLSRVHTICETAVVVMVARLQH